MEIEEDSKQVCIRVLEKTLLEKNISLEELKATNQMEWVSRMNNISNCIDEIIFERYIYV